MRFAGQTSAHWLSDNGLTRSWADTIGRRLIAPLERRGMPDDDIRGQLAMYLALEAAGDGQLGMDMRLRLAQLGQLAEGPNSVLGRPAYLDAIEAKMKGVVAEQGEDQMRKDLAGTIMEQFMGGMDRAALVKAEPLMNSDWRQGYTERGNLARNILAGPIPAYGAVAGGLGVGVIGVQEVMKKLELGEALTPEEAEVAEEAVRSEAQP